MVEIIKYEFNNYNCFDFHTDNGFFQILFCGNLDLYFNYHCTGNVLDEYLYHRNLHIRKKTI